MKATGCKVGTLALLLLAAASCEEEPPFFIPGTATLPACEEPPAFELANTRWGYNGIVTIESTGCQDAQPGDEFTACSLTWVMSPDGPDVEILSDEEYIILGRLCGDTFYLEGGWWLTVEDDGCDFEDESSSDEVRIQMGGSSLTVAEASPSPLLRATGVLSLQGSCTASFAMDLSEF